jgi:hypothetical protein
MPKPLGIFHPDFVGDTGKIPWYLKLAIALLFLFAIVMGIVTL